MSARPTNNDNDGTCRGERIQFSNSVLSRPSPLAIALEPLPRYPRPPTPGVRVLTRRHHQCQGGSLALVKWIHAAICEREGEGEGEGGPTQRQRQQPSVPAGAVGPAVPAQYLTRRNRYGHTPIGYVLDCVLRL